MSTPLEKALALAALVPPVHVFPVKQDKSPKTPNGFKDASADPDVIRTMNWTDSLVGYWAGASGVDVLDIDTHGSVDGFTTLAQFSVHEPTAIDYDSSVKYSTPSGGEHHVYRASVALKPTGNYMKLAGIDRRSGESYAIWYGDAPTQETWSSLPSTPAWFSLGARGGGGSTSSNVAPFTGDLLPWLETLTDGPADPELAVECFHRDDLKDPVRDLVKASVYYPERPGLAQAFLTILNSYKASTVTSIPDDQREGKVLDLVRYWLPRVTEELAELGGLDAMQWALKPSFSQPWDGYAEPIKTVMTEAERAASQEDKFQQSVRDAMYQKKVIQEAERRLGAEGYTGTEELSWEAMEAAEQTHMVEDLLPDDSVTFLIAKANLGKTFTFIDMVCSMATGKAWLGKRTRQVKTLIVLGEGRNGFIDRLRGWCEANGKIIDDLKPWLFFMDGANLNSDESLERIKEVMDREAVELVVWDTWANVSGIQKEEDNALNSITMTRVLGIRPKTTHLFVHHPRKAEENTDAPVMRGAGALYGRADVVMTMYRDSKYTPTTGEKHEYLALSTEAAHEGKNRTAGTETIRGLYLGESGESQVLRQLTAESISKTSRQVQANLTGPMTVKEYMEVTGQTEATARRHLLKAVIDGIALHHKSEVQTQPDQFSPNRTVIVAPPLDWTAMASKAKDPKPTATVTPLTPMGGQPVAPVAPDWVKSKKVI